MAKKPSDPRRARFDDVVEAIESGRLSRREFVRRATALGLSATAIGSVLAACGGGDSSAPETEAPATSAPAESTAPAEEPAATTQAEKPYDGQTVRMIVVAEGEDRAVQAKVGEIKDRFGIDLETTPLAVGPLIEKENQSVTAGEGAFDIVNVLGFSVSQIVGGGFVEPLKPYLDDPAKTPSDYDFADFIAGQLEYVGYFDTTAGQFGGDDLYLIPGFSAASILLYYRTDLLEAAGLQPPTTWEEYQAAAQALNQGDVAGNSLIAKSGDVSMFLVDWYTRFITVGGVLMNGSPSEQNFMPNLTSPEAVSALQGMVDCVQYAPAGVLEYDFTASVDSFAAGKTAMMLMWSSIAGTMFNPETSTVADKIGVATSPGTGANAGKAIRGGWGLGIPKNAQNKDAAWQVISYFTSKEYEKYQTLEFQKDPSRMSTYADAELIAALPYLPTSGQAIENAQILEIALIPEAFELIAIAAEDFSAALNGSASATDTLARAQGRWEEVLRRGGYLA